LISKPLAIVSDAITEAHVRIQADFKDLNPVVGVSQNMRSSGIPADAITIDCLKSGKRIILVLHDEQPATVRYQYSFRDKDPSPDFELIQLNDLTTEKLYQWMVDYLSES
jgi:hypothetical protein